MSQKHVAQSLLSLVQTQNVYSWSAGIPNETLRSLCAILCTEPAKTRKEILAVLSDTLRTPRHFQGLLAKWGAAAREDYLHNTQAWPEAARLFDAHVHFVSREGGSGVLLSPDLILTCAHCVAAPDDPLEEDEDTEPPPKRVGRTRLLVLPSGGFVVAECIRACEEVDLALLRVLAASPELGRVTAFPTCPPTPKGKEIVLVGNPAKITIRPPLFHTSRGKVLGDTDPKRKKLGLGGVLHSAWTYWGHSGAPLINARGEVCGVHNTWDGPRNTRHAVSPAEIAEFVGAELAPAPAPPLPLPPPPAALAMRGGGGGAAESAGGGEGRRTRWELPEDEDASGESPSEPRRKKRKE
jgi:hypothetical protein